MSACPSCRKIGQILQAYPSGFQGFTRTMFRVECACGVTGGWGFSGDEANSAWSALSALRRETVEPTEAPEPFQKRVRAWSVACFGEAIANDTTERNHRFLEESLELVQALGCTESEAQQLVAYVFGRPVGEPRQELGGVMVTLAALCNAQVLAGTPLYIDADAEVELERVWGLLEKIRAKQKSKPKHSPLPAASGIAEIAARGLVGIQMLEDRAAALDAALVKRTAERDEARVQRDAAVAEAQHMAKLADAAQAHSEAMEAQRDEAVARLAAIKNPAPFPSERFVATVIAMMPEWFNDDDATDSFRALTKALRDAATDPPRDTPAVIVERATGVPEAASIQIPKEDACRIVDALRLAGFEVTVAAKPLIPPTPAAPPVAKDAEAALKAFEKLAYEHGWESAKSNAYPMTLLWNARRDVLSRMRPPITAEAMQEALEATWARRPPSPLWNFGGIAHCKAILAALEGCGK